MKTKPTVPRARATQDVEEAIAYYLAEDAVSAALGFVDALERAYMHVGRLPQAGSPHYAHELEIPGLRSWPLKRYPYVVFYLEREEHIDVWRVLHAQRDLPASLMV